MASQAVVQVVGARQLRRALTAAGDDLEDLKAANRAVAGLVVASARPATPHRSGVLAGSVRGSGTKTAAVVRAGSARVPYAGVIEYGWPARHITAQPWLIDTGRATESRWTQLYLDAVNKIIETIDREVNG